MKIKDKVHQAVTYVYSFLMQSVYGVKKNKAVFISFGGKNYSDNPRAVSETLHERAPETDIVWVMKKASGKLPSYVRTVSPESALAYGKEIATAGALVTNLSLPRIHKSGKQLYIQTWHGDRAFKKIQLDNPFLSKGFYVAEARPGYCDYCVAGSDYGERKFRSAFRYKGEILKTGTPRDDVLVSPDDQKVSALRAALKVPEETRILLYAPTLRKKSKKGQDVKDFDVEKTLNALEKKYSCDWICFVRAHPAVEKLDGIRYNDKVWNVSGYEDMTDLLLISDMLITDYSSCAGDFALLNRPLVLFQPDREEYIREERTFYFDIFDSPYYIAEDQAQLESIIAALDDSSVIENCRRILAFYGCCETGHAARDVADIIVRHMES